MTRQNDTEGKVDSRLQAIRQVTQKWLRIAGETPEPSMDPAFQLMIWGLDQGVRFRDHSYTCALRGNVEYLAFQADDQNLALQYVLERPDFPDEPFLDDDELARAESPEQASTKLLWALDAALTEDPNAGGWPPIYPKVDD